MRSLRLILLVCAVGLVATGSALADHLDPQKRFTPADQARARSMLLKKSDLVPGFTSDRGGGSGDTHVDCAAAVGEADLVQTGQAKAPTFQLGVTSVQSLAAVWESVADSSASWRRGTSAAGTNCMRTFLRREFANERYRFVSLRKLAFPPVSQRASAYRILFSAKTPQATVKIYLDFVTLMRSRAHARLIFASAFQPVSKAEEVRLARIVAGRMARAMRG